MLNEDKMPMGLAGEGWEVAYAKPSAFTGATPNTRGDDGGTSDPIKLFTVTGDVLVRIFGVCTTAPTGATATVSVGVAGNVGGLLPVTTATDLVANEIWNDTTPTEVGAGLLSGVLGPYIIVEGLDINEYVATADVATGQIYYVCFWRKISADGNVVGS